MTWVNLEDTEFGDIIQVTKGQSTVGFQSKAVPKMPSPKTPEVDTDLGRGRGASVGDKQWGQSWEDKQVPR